MMQLKFRSKKRNLEKKVKLLTKLVKENNKVDNVDSLLDSISD